MGSRRGLTLVELMITLSLASVAFYSIAALVRASSSFYNVSSTNMDVVGQGSRVVHQLANSLRSTDLDSIAALPVAPLCDTTLLFQTVEPFEDTATVTSDPIRITLVAGEVLRADSFLMPEQRERVLTRGVPDFFEGETFNGLDDNGNGFVDEPGLFFAREDSAIVVGLTLVDGDVTRSWITRVVCRN